MNDSNISNIRPVKEEDWQFIFMLIEHVFVRQDEAKFLKKIIEDNDLIYSLVSERHKDINGFISFSRLNLEHNGQIYPGVILAPFVVDPLWQGKKIGSKLIQRSHIDLKAAGEKYATVLGDEDYYNQFGYSHAAGERFNGPYSGPYSLTSKWSDDVPDEGNLIYPRAFAECIGARQITAA